MDIYHDFPVVIIDEDFNAEHATGRGMRQMASAIEGLGWRLVSGISYADAEHLVSIVNKESCWVVSVDGLENRPEQWERLEKILLKRRERNDKLPIFLFGDKRTAELVPPAVLRHSNAFMQLFEDSPEFLARSIAFAAGAYVNKLAPPMFRALMDYTLHGAYSWHTPGHGGGIAFRKSPVGQLFYSFFGENTLRSDVSVSVGALGSLLDHTGPIAEGENNAARIFGADHTLFVVGGTSAANKIVWHAMVGKGDLVLCDRNCHKSILHSLIMTGAIPIYLIPSRNALGIIGPISRQQFTPEAIKSKIESSTFAKQTDGKIRLMVMTNSTYDGLCYNVDSIKESLKDSVEVLHFDEAWYAYANFHEFYDGYHAISSNKTSRNSKAITVATQSTHKLLAAFSQASMIHVQNAQNKTLDISRFNEAFMMHTSTSPQYGIIASCDVAAAMMEQPAGRTLIQETIDEAMAFRRALTGVGKEIKGKWWFKVWQPDEMSANPRDRQEDWVLNPNDSWHGFGDIAANHAMVDPIKVTLLSPGISIDGILEDEGIPAAIVTKFLSSRRIEIEKTGLYSFLILFSMGITKGKWSTLITELLNFRDLYDSNALVRDLLPALVEKHPEHYAKMGLRDLCQKMHEAYGKFGFHKSQREMYTVLPEMVLRPTDAYDKLVRGEVESVPIDELMGRTTAVMVVPYPPGIPVIMPGEKFTKETKSIQDFLLQAREFDQEIPGFEIDIHGLRFEKAPNGKKRYLVDCIKMQ